MAVLNFAHREITAKIVYFGAPGAGCNTNVQALHAALEAEEGDRGRLHRFARSNAQEHTWFFDMQPSAATLSGFSIRYRIYSMPGGVEDPTHRAEVMRKVDAIVLVVDSRARAASSNETAMLELEEVVASQGLDLAKLPVVLQVNHLDEPDARPASDATLALNPFGFPVVSATATEGTGVRETFDTITALARERLADNISGGGGAVSLVAEHRATRETDEDVARQHERALSPTPEAQTTTRNAGPTTPAPADEVEVAFQPRDFAGSYPVRIVKSDIDDGQVFVDVELERMGGGELRQLRVFLANRPTDAPAVARAPSFSVIDTTTTPPSVMGVTDHLPDKVSFTPEPPAAPDDLPPVTYGIIGIAGGLVAGLLLGFLLFG